jgi:hypothetical protein
VRFVKQVDVSVNAGTATSDPLKIGGFPNQVVPSIQRLAGSGVVDTMVQGAVGGRKAPTSNNNWETIVEVNGIADDLAHGTEAKLSVWEWMRVIASSPNDATVRLMVVGMG